MNDLWWQSVEGKLLAQGDLLPDCCLPIFVDPVPQEDDTKEQEIEVVSQRLIVVTQSCDLENEKVQFVALCPVHSLDEFSEFNPHYSNTKNWESVRRGQVHALHLIRSHDEPDINTKSFVVDFGHIVSLPIEYLSDHATALGPRHRLRPPFLEHFSQAFARFFMRVGLPSGIASFK